MLHPSRLGDFLDPKRIVAQGYNQIAERYVTWAGHVRTRERERYTRVLLDSLPDGAAVLDVGCGSGIPL